MAPCFLSVLFLLAATPTAGENLLTNGDFQQGHAGWSDLWTRTPGGRLTFDRQQRHGGTQSARIEHSDHDDWSLAYQQQIKVRPGEIFELSGWVRVRGEGNATLGVVLRDSADKAIDWSFGGQRSEATDDWRPLRSRFVVPPGAATMQPRLIGERPATVWFADARLVRQGSIDALRPANLPATLKVENRLLEATIHTADATLTIVDRRSGRRWTQSPRSNAIVLEAQTVDNGLDLALLDTATMLRLKATMRLEPGRPEVVVELSAKGEMHRPVSFPEPLTTDKNTRLILPLNEGISYPADDPAVNPAYEYFYGGHGLCMAWYGQTAADDGAAALTIVETPDDAGADLQRHDGLLSLAPRWESQRGQFGYTRRLRWVFFNDGGYVAMCKRYRQYAKDSGLLKTLAQKRAVNPNVDLLAGAVNVWCWDRDAVGICRELQAAGIGRILWSNAAGPDTLARLNSMGILTSRYDIYQDLMNPAEFPKLQYIHPDWTTAGWPKDIMLDAQGRWLRGWAIEGKDGQWHPCGVLCDSRAPGYARPRITEELKTHPYRCRFIDTTTASPWRECYNPDHPMTRSESRVAKMELLRVVSEECHLVTGSETGHEAAVPYASYFEGMMSLGPYRVPDAGRNMSRILDEVPERLARFQTGHAYRLPLWELVYHDCLVAQWYWGDYNNKLPEVWDRRDLFNCLYGTPPMFMFDHKRWLANRERFVQSYRTATPVARATAYAEMLSHRWLTADHAVQQTRFANGVTVTVNFGDRPYTMPAGPEIPPLGHRIEGIR